MSACRFNVNSSDHCRGCENAAGAAAYGVAAEMAKRLLASGHLLPGMKNEIDKLISDLLVLKKESAR